MGRSLFITLLFTSIVWAKTTYTIEDLESLAHDSLDEEFFEHALDIRPSERNSKWKGLVTKMGDALTSKILRKQKVTKADFTRVEKLLSWPALKADDIYRARRSEIGFKYIEQCFKTSQSCWDELIAFWNQDKSDPEISFKLAKITSNQKNSPVKTWTFLSYALKSPLSEFYCKKDFVLKELWNEIDLSYVKIGPKGDLSRNIEFMIHPDCLPSLIEFSKNNLLSPSKVTDRELAFQILRTQSKDDQSITDFFYTVYLLENPSQGELFNYSWNRIKELGGTIERRNNVLKTLKTLDPLPDEVLSSYDQTKKKVILKHFNQYFPEYLNFYTNQCISFYSGKKSFPNGNPTIHCNELLNSDLASGLIDDSKIKEYHKYRNI